MLVTLILWIIILITGFFAGYLFYQLFGRILGYSRENAPSLTVIVLLGIAAITLFSLYSAFFIPVGMVSDGIILGIIIISVILSRKNLAGWLKQYQGRLRGVNPLIIILFIVIAGVILFETACFPPKNYDTALYHAQNIHLNEISAIITGAGNIHKRLAYNSSWFLTGAFFSFSWLGGRSYHALNGLLLLLVSLFCIGGIRRLLEGGKEYTAWAKALILPVALYLFSNFASSPDTDLPAAVMVYILFLINLEKAEKGDLFRFDGYSFITFFLSAMILTIKLSALPITLFALIIALSELFKKDWKRFLVLSALAVLSVAPWLVRNVIISGYLVYPFSNLDLFRFDWKIPRPILIEDLKGIELYSFPIRGQSFFSYLPKWLVWIKVQYKMVLYPLIGLGLLSSAFAAVRVFSRLNEWRDFIQSKKQIFWIYGAAFVSIVFLYNTAPDFRYGSSFFVFFLVLFIVPGIAAVYMSLNRFKPVIYGITICLMIFSVGFEGMLVKRYFSKNDSEGVLTLEKPSVLKNRIIQPADYQTDPLGYDEHGLTNGSFAMTVYSSRSHDRSWYKVFPAVPKYEWGHFGTLELRGQTLRDGFRTRMN